MMYKGIKRYLADPVEGMLSISGTKFAQIIQYMKEHALESEEDIKDL
jgi:hypothetical protein